MSQVQNSLFEIDVSEMRAFFNRMHQAGTGDLRKAMQRWLEGIGLEFLRIIQDEIIRRQVVDTRMLLQSFQKDDDNNVWTLSEEDLELEVGTTLEYASYVNDGHWTNPKGVEKRFIPGDVEIGPDGKVVKFQYNPSVSTGITLKQKWVSGKPYFTSGLKVIEKMLPNYLDALMEQWIENYFKGVLK